MKFELWEKVEASRRNVRRLETMCLSISRRLFRRVYGNAVFDITVGLFRSILVLKKWKLLAASFSVDSYHF